METVASWHGEVNYKRYQSLGVVGRLVELGSHDSQLPPRADPRARATVLFLLLSPSRFSPLASLPPTLLPHLPPSLLFLPPETFSPVPSFPIFPTSVSHGRTHTAPATDAVDARVHGNAYTHIYTCSLSRQYRKLKDWAMIARGPTWPFHPPPALPAIYRLGATAEKRRKERKEGRERAFVLLGENYRIGREK